MEWLERNKWNGCERVKQMISMWLIPFHSLHSSHYYEPSSPQQHPVRQRDKTDKTDRHLVKHQTSQIRRNISDRMELILSRAVLTWTKLSVFLTCSRLSTGRPTWGFHQLFSRCVWGSGPGVHRPGWPTDQTLSLQSENRWETETQSPDDAAAVSLPRRNAEGREWMEEWRRERINDSQIIYWSVSDHV